MVILGMTQAYHPLPLLNPAYIKKEDYFLLFESGLSDKDNYLSYIFINPLTTIEIKSYCEVESAFAKIEDYAQRYFLAGYFSYELGYYFEKRKFALKEPAPFPLARLCVFDKGIVFDHRSAKLNAFPPGLFLKERREESFSVKNLKFNFPQKEYAKKIARIKRHIRSGDTYQINLTGKYHFGFSGSAFAFYENLKKRQNVPYNAFCKFKDKYVLSFSPELFFKRSGLAICSRPMKGTIGRGKDRASDRVQMLRLKSSKKDRAENIMIVDLMRNDFGRIALGNSVKAKALFDIEKYNTLFQMTSEVRAVLKKGVTYFEIFKSIFPGGSVTGAPKIRSMQIIRQLEKEPRNIYCGALGIILPEEKAVFNMPIRTISIIGNKGQMGVGSGIVYDSGAASEFRECILKAKFLTDQEQDFSLLESMLWDKGYKFLSRHLRRMRESARGFNFSFYPLKIKKALGSLENKFKKGESYKVRLLSDKNGKIKLEGAVIHPQAGIKYAAVSKYRVDPKDLFCYHKTTKRSLYDAEHKYYAAGGYFDVLFLNTKGEVAEGAISNIILQKDNKYYTPLVSCGILPGILRSYLIKKYAIKEKKLYLKDLFKADKIFLCNSVRGLTEVKLKTGKG